MSRTHSDNLDLTPGQQGLLIAALNSNKSSPMQDSNLSFQSNNKRSTSQGINYKSSSFPDFTGTMPGSGSLDLTDESPYLDFDLDGEVDESFNFSHDGQLFGDLPGDDLGDDDSLDRDNDLHDKRKSVGDDGDSPDQGDAKRREGDDKQAKKPGRKPLTNEPTSKRKAQNRAAQRAFRERKEQHLKDLETKVEDLEKASDATSHENGLLRAQVERLQIELKEYRKRLSWISSNGLARSSPTVTQPKPTSVAAQSDFQFAFPKFGDLPATQIFDSGNQKGQSTPSRAATLPTKAPTLPAQNGNTRHSMSSASPQAQVHRQSSTSASPLSNGYSISPQPQQQVPQIDGLSGLFSPSILQATKPSSHGYFPRQGNNSSNQTSRGSYDNRLGNVPGLYSNSSISNSDSPGSSSESQQQNSSIGTSPNPSLHSPGNKLNEFNLNTINENQVANTFGSSSIFDPNFDTNGINWMAQQNGGGFDPVLFGDYRESQDNILSQDFGSFFNDAYPLPDLGSPSHNFNDLANPGLPKDNLLQRVESAQAGPDNEIPVEVEKPMTCNKIWDRLQSMEKFRNGEIDIDNLCSELRAKARCSEGGAVVNSLDVDKILGSAK